MISSEEIGIIQIFNFKIKGTNFTLWEMNNDRIVRVHGTAKSIWISNPIDDVKMCCSNTHEYDEVHSYSMKIITNTVKRVGNSDKNANNTHFGV